MPIVPSTPGPSSMSAGGVVESGATSMPSRVRNSRVNASHATTA